MEYVCALQERDGRMVQVCRPATCVQPVSPVPVSPVPVATPVQSQPAPVTPTVTATGKPVLIYATGGALLLILFFILIFNRN